MDTVQAGRITINSALPSLILASNSGGLAVDDHNLFSSFKNAGSVSLEGDFNKYFDLYSPRDDPVSAFNTLPPNLMAVLIDEFQDTCVEFVGNSIYLMIVTDETQSSFGDGVPVFNAQVNDKLISQSLKLASFFKTPLAENNQPINPNEVITEKHIPTIHIG
jgi:hypothetical protein